jgi:hypothetical protein
MCLVGHVDRFFGDYRLLGSPLLQRLVEQDTGVALEFVDRSKAELLGTAARKVAIVQSSDSHRLEEIGRRRTVIEAEELSFEGIRAALLPRVLEAAS